MRKFHFMEITLKAGILSTFLDNSFKSSKTFSPNIILDRISKFSDNGIKQFTLFVNICEHFRHYTINCHAKNLPAKLLVKHFS